MLWTIFVFDPINVWRALIRLWFAFDWVPFVASLIEKDDEPRSEFNSFCALSISVCASSVSWTSFSSLSLSFLNSACCFCNCSWNFLSSFTTCLLSFCAFVLNLSTVVLSFFVSWVKDSTCSPLASALAAAALPSDTLSISVMLSEDVWELEFVVPVFDLRDYIV